MSQIPELQGGRALEHNAPFETGKGISNKDQTATITVTSSVWTVTGGLSLGVSGTGIDTTFYGDTAGRDLIWDQSENTLRAQDNAKTGWGSGAGTTPDIGILWDGTDLLVSQLTADSIVKWGVSGAGINHVFYGDTATRDMTWDQSNDQLLFADNAKLAIGSGAGAAGDITFSWDATRLNVNQLTANSEIRWGVDGAGIDQLFYGDTASVSMTWDQSVDSLIFSDNAKLVLGSGSDVTVAWDNTDLDITCAADDTIIKFGTGTNSFDIWLYGNIATSYLLWDASADLLRSVGPVRQDVNVLGRRYNLKWVAGQRGKPSINADIQNAAEATREIADPDFEVLGTNASSDDVTFNAEGGVTIETDGADGDEVIILPHLDANQSAWAQVTWGTDKETEWECHIKTSTNITNAIIWAGLKLTNTEVTATDNDQAFFRYEDDVNSGKWQAIYSIAGTDTATDSGVTVATSTEYHLKVAIDSSRVPRFYINGALVATGTALSNTTDFIPYIGVAADGAGAAKKIDVYGQAISRVIG